MYSEFLVRMTETHLFASLSPLGSVSGSTCCSGLEQGGILGPQTYCVARSKRLLASRTSPLEFSLSCSEYPCQVDYAVCAFSSPVMWWCGDVKHTSFEQPIPYLYRSHYWKFLFWTQVWFISLFISSFTWIISALQQPFSPSPPIFFPPGLPHFLWVLR